MAFRLNHLNRIVVATCTSTIGMFKLNRYDFMGLGDGQKQGAGNSVVRLMPQASWHCGRMTRLSAATYSARAETVMAGFCAHADHADFGLR